ncbi:unnamed protein product, partial [Musa textilis]
MIKIIFFIGFHFLRFYHSTGLNSYIHPNHGRPCELPTGRVESSRAEPHGEQRQRHAYASGCRDLIRQATPLSTRDAPTRGLPCQSPEAGPHPFTCGYAWGGW